jgi:arylsulfatase A-like enzyme
MNGIHDNHQISRLKMRFVGAVATLGFLLASCQSTATDVELRKDRPNIVFILIDDLGKEWLSCYGAEDIETPNIDRLATTGMRFENVYSMPQCTPSRVCFLTGQYPWRNGWINHWDAPRWGEGYYDWRRNPSIASAMKQAGYATAAAGKWQLNDFRIHPDAMARHGFDDWCMWTGAEGSKNKHHIKQSSRRYWDPYIHTREGSKTHTGRFGPDIYHQFVLDFIDDHREEPFFIYYPMALTHLPLTTTPLHPVRGTDEEMFTHMLLYADHLLGKLVSHLEQRGLRENTIIVWTTDNGSPGMFTRTRNGRKVRGGKAHTTENGVNAPFIVSCPGLVPAGVVSEALVDFTDMLPTFVDLAGGKPDPDFDYDGVSFKDVMLGKAKSSSRDWILAMGCNPARLTEAGVENVFYFRDRVLRDGRFKLFVDTERQPGKLIDLSVDPNEKKDLKNDPTHAETLGRLVKVIENLPQQDADPDYTRLPRESWWAAPKHPSQNHKIGYPEKPTSEP